VAYQLTQTKGFERVSMVKSEQQQHWHQQ